MPTAGLWTKAQRALANGRELTVREISAEIDYEAFEVRNCLNAYARKGKVVRVLPLTGPLKWRLTNGAAS